MVRLLLIMAMSLFALGAAMPAMRPVDRGAAGGVQSGYFIDINTVEAPTLTLLPGIGPALGERIVEHRESNGPFKTIDDLKDVRGIGDVIVERLRPFATVGAGGTKRRQ